MSDVENKSEGEWVDVSVAQDGGVRKRVLTEGHGDAPAQKSKVRVHYTGTLKSGMSLMRRSVAERNREGGERAARLCTRSHASFAHRWLGV